jgi:hypothetical protein
MSGRKRAAMAAYNDAENFKERRTLALLVEICSEADETTNAAIERGEKPDYLEAFMQAMSTLDLSEQQLMRVWSMLLLGSQTAKKLHRERAGEAQQVEMHNPHSLGSPQQDSL